MTIQKRIKIAREQAELDQVQLGKAVGVSQQAVQKWEGKGMPGLLRIPRIAKVCNVRAEWLTTGEGDMLPLDEVNRLAREAGIKDDYDGIIKNSIIINEYTDVSGSMGSGLTLRDQPGQITEWTVTPEWVTKNIPSNTGNQNLRIVTGFGDSMRGMFNSGDPLIIDAGVNSIDYDGVYFFRVGDEGFIKRLQRIPGKGIAVISENKAYETWHITQDMDIEIFGRVLKVWKSEGF